MSRLVGCLLFVGAFCCGMAVTAFIKFPPRVSADWAAWAQAVGSVAAIVAAIWVAFRADRLRRVEAFTAARVTAGGLMLKLTVAQDVLSVARLWFKTVTETDGDPTEFTRQMHEISKVDIGEKGDWTSLIPLPKSCALKLAAANGMLHVTVSQLRDFTSSDDHLLGDSRKEQAKETGDTLDAILILLESASKECDAASQFE